ncbi:hypothetical protein RhiirC2_799906 [Rhizophagus irregularis]|uniref:Uncharacterized protein n=1 Tax=Rhizophagus irregularis TaxID=588596 RepID=A0A2N1M4A8_9GLOM|nr:hypothetical protein RhiirC2_799906 [Rhizophagus irregularis]
MGYRAFSISLLFPCTKNGAANISANPQLSAIPQIFRKSANIQNTAIQLQNICGIAEYLRICGMSTKKTNFL